MFPNSKADKYPKPYLSAPHGPNRQREGSFNGALQQRTVETPFATDSFQQILSVSTTNSATFASLGSPFSAPRREGTSGPVRPCDLDSDGTGTACVLLSLNLPTQRPRCPCLWGAWEVPEVACPHRTSGREGPPSPVLTSPKFRWPARCARFLPSKYNSAAVQSAFRCLLATCSFLLATLVGDQQLPRHSPQRNFVLYDEYRLTRCKLLEQGFICLTRSSGGASLQATTSPSQLLQQTSWFGHSCTRRAPVTSIYLHSVRGKERTHANSEGPTKATKECNHPSAS